jgi:hypothetical protein
MALLPLPPATTLRISSPPSREPPNRSNCILSHFLHTAQVVCVFLTTVPSSQLEQRRR